MLAILAGGWYAGYRVVGNDGDLGFAGQPYFFSSVLGLLIVIVGFSLLFTARYPKGLFDLVMGINRWVFRVTAYAALMRDEYPPFQLVQGPSEPSAAPLPASPNIGEPAYGASISAPVPQQSVSEHEAQPPHPRDWFNG